VPTPVRTGPPGRPLTPPRSPAPGEPTKEATTTHRSRTQPTPMQPTPAAPATGHAAARQAAARQAAARQAAGDPTARRADETTHAAVHSGGRRPGRQMARRLVVAGLLAGGLAVVLASPAYAAGGGTQTLSGLISNLTTWIVGILAGVATLFLTIGGLRYLTAGGDPGQVEKAKTALKSAAVGYALAVLAPLIVSILASLVGGG
jgi:hypothetical protein